MLVAGAIESSKLGICRNLVCYMKKKCFRNYRICILYQPAMVGSAIRACAVCRPKQKRERAKISCIGCSETNTGRIPNILVCNYRYTQYQRAATKNGVIVHLVVLASKSKPCSAPRTVEPMALRWSSFRGFSMLQLQHCLAPIDQVLACAGRELNNTCSPHRLQQSRQIASPTQIPKSLRMGTTPTAS